MKTSIRGRFAVAALCAVLAACGGDGGSDTPTALPASVAIANPLRAEAGAAAAFSTDLATPTGLTFRWDFGDGSTATGATASHAYAHPGVYQVTLAVVNDAEDLRTATSTIQVGAYANVAGLACSQADGAGWCWQHAIVTGHQINDVVLVDATHAWAVGDGLTILKSIDGGATWSQVALDATLATASLRSVRFYDAMHGMALNDQGGALQTRDGGVTWTATLLGGLVYSGPTTFADYRPGRIVLQSDNTGSGVMSVDDGSTWTVVATDCWSFNSSSVQRAAGCGPNLTTALSASTPNGYEYFSGGAFSSDTQALVVGYGYSYDSYTQSAQAWSTSDGGANWTSFVPNGLPYYLYYGMTLHMLDAQKGVLYNPNDLTAYATADGGHDWTQVNSSASLLQAYSSYRGTGFVGNGVLWQSIGNQMSISLDQGQTWRDATVHAEDAAAQSGQTSSAAVTQYTDASDFVVATSHRFYATNDGGQTFRRLLGPDSRDAGSPYAAGEFTDIRNGKFLTANGALLSTIDGGRTWTRLDYPSTVATPVALHFTSATEGWLVLGGKLAHSTDGGATWSTPLTGSAMLNLQGMSWANATHGWTWNYGALFVTADGGATWVQAIMPNNFGVTSATMTGPLTGVAVSTYNGAAITQDGGATWQAVSTTYAFGSLVHASGQTVWALNYYGLLRSKDGGRTWQAAGPVTSNAIIGLAFADDKNGWLITGAGGLLRTIDGGDSWAAQPVGPDLQLQAIAAVDSMTAWVITRDGQILSTATAGQ
jgi:photosystem II stability/assembly factor-like uncharacterized protein